MFPWAKLSLNLNLLISLLLNYVTFSSFSYIDVLYSFINLTILDFIHISEIAFFLFSVFSF